MKVRFEAFSSACPPPVFAQIFTARDQYEGVDADSRGTSYPLIGMKRWALTQASHTPIQNRRNRKKLTI